jgi:class 3 adenylate cyclase/DNA-binding CsgD family transcriptional regulator
MAMTAAVATALPGGTVTFLFSDIEGSTSLLRELGPERYGALLERHNELVRAAIAGAGGVEIDRTGDSFFAAFPSAGAAAEAAIAAQRALGAETWPGTVRVRMGLHTGEATLAGGGYVGLAVHHAARIGDAGHGGQVLLSATTAALVEHSLPGGVGLLDLGEVRLPSLDRPTHLHQLVIEDLPQRFPPLATRTIAAPGDNGATLLERDGELGSIRAAVDGAVLGAGRLVAIEGRAGMGKTRLVAEARATAQAAGFEVLVARGGELERDFAYGIVRQLFEPALAAAGGDERAELTGGAATLAARLFDDGPLETTIEGEPDTSFAMLHGLYWLAVNVAQRRPTLLAVDDLHWSDLPSLRWLLYVARRLEGLPLLVVAGLRPPEQSRERELLTELVADPAALVIRPTALGPASIAQLGREVFGAEPHPAFVEAARRASGGNPLLVRALLETLASERVEPSAEQAERVLEIGPEPVARGVALRLSRLPAEATALARAVAVLGDGAQLDHAGRLAELDPELAGHVATTLARADLLRLEMPLEFVHPVVRAAVYETIPPNERPSAHARAALVLHECGCAPEQAAAHFLLAPPAGNQELVATLRGAARRALRRGAPEAAIGFLQRALEEPPARPAELLVDLAFAERRVDTAAAADRFGEAIQQIENPQRRGEIALEWGRSLVRSNRHAQAVPVYQDALAGLDGHDPELTRLLEGELISSAWWEPDLLPIAEEGVEAIRPEELEHGLGRDVLLAQLAFRETRLGVDRERAAALALEAATSVLIEAEASLARYLIGFTLIASGRTDDALRFHDAVLASARARGDLVTAGGIMIFRSLLYMNLGDLRSAESDLRETQRLNGQNPSYTALPYHAAFLALALLERGAFDEAQAVLDAPGFPDTLPPNAHLFFFQNARGRLKLARGDAEGALAEFTLLGEHMDSMGMRNPAFLPWRAGAAVSLQRLGRADEAAPLAREELENARRWGDPRTVGIALRTLGIVEGGSSGEDLLREAVDQLAASSAQLSYARGLLELGAALRRRNKRSEARDYLRRALELAYRSGAEPLAERAQTELAATGARPRRLVLTGLDSLTPSERRVAEMAAEGMSNKEIAQTLFVTTKTVEVHLSNVYRKLEIASRAQLAGVLEPVPVL